MATPANSPAPGGRARSAHDDDERLPASAELQFLLIAIAFVVVMLLAGVPGEVKKAGDGSPALQRGWAERHTAEVAAQLAAQLAAEQPGATTGLPGAETPDAAPSDRR
jgi:hypothetical protein